MFQLTYISTAVSVSDAVLTSILATSRRRNLADRLTGLLIFNGKRFLQALEGPEDKVVETFGRIRLDPRHRATVVLSSKPTEVRQFGSWSMACDVVSSGTSEACLAATVDSLVAHVADPNMKALFSSYARIVAAA